MEIKTAAVIGAGVMGSGIAAHLANAGIYVMLIDIVPVGANDRSSIARGAIARLLKTDPAPLTHKRNARRITPANIEDDLGKLAEADWIIEVVVEKLEIKHEIYKKIDAHRKKGSIVSSNTSTIPLAQLAGKMPASFQRDFLITHFFNPPRYMRLLEFVAGPKTDAKTVDALREFCDTRLGKGVVDCKDTPGFIANRIGTLWGQSAINNAMDMGLTVEEADSIVGRPMGVPKTGVFGLMDLVGLDLMPHVARSLYDNVPDGDPFKAMYRESEMLTRMIADGYTGRKGKGGFYRLNKEGGKRVKEALDLETGEYRVSVKARLDSAKEGAKDLWTLVNHADKGGQYAWAVLADTLCYAADLVPEIADHVASVDEAMRLGYAWKWGPFEMLDRIGPARFAAKLAEDGRAVPKLIAQVGDGGFYRVEGGVREYFTTGGDFAPLSRRPGMLLLSDIKRRSEPVEKNASARIWDIGDGVACLEFHSYMNAIDGDIMAMVDKAVAVVKKGDPFKALVIHNEAENFSVGANIGLALFAANIAAWPLLETTIANGQRSYKALKYAPFPVVGAPSGMALGGGCEILLHCDAVQAHIESYIGLVEVGVGVVPGWGGCKELLMRWSAEKKRPGGPMPPVAQAFETISTAKVGRSAEESRELKFLRATDGITMNRDRLLADAKERALELAKDYAPPEPQEIQLPGPSARAALDLFVEGFVRQGKASAHDQLVAGHLAKVISGGDTDLTETVSEDDITKLELAAFMALLHEPKTLARIEHTLETGKPLRN